MKRLIVAMLFGISALGQNTLSLSGPDSKTGTGLRYLITITTSSPAVSALQWDVAVAPSVPFQVTGAIKEKPVICNAAHCVLIGGQSAIPNGTVAYLDVNPPKDPTGPISISLSNVKGALADGSALAMSGSSIHLEPKTGARVLEHGSAIDNSPRTWTIFGDSIPHQTDTGKDNPVELGLRFMSDVEGIVVGVRYYKSAPNVGPHKASLWSNDGKTLARAGFDNETASGWQTATFPEPVPVQAGTTYTVSYYCPHGHYAADSGFFTQQFDHGPLKVPSRGGVFVYGTPPGFPTSVHDATNYWVDVLFRPK